MLVCLAFKLANLGGDSLQVLGVDIEVLLDFWLRRIKGCFIVDFEQNRPWFESSLAFDLDGTDMVDDRC